MIGWGIVFVARLGGLWVYGLGLGSLAGPGLVTLEILGLDCVLGCFGVCAFELSFAPFGGFVVLRISFG